MSALLAGVLLSVALASGVFGAASCLNVPTLATPPEIDGLVRSDEWDAASGGVIALGAEDGTLVGSPGVFRIGRAGGTLYLLLYTDKMERMPTAKAGQRDANLWEDDAFEVFLRTPAGLVQLIANSAGIIYDSLDGDPAWNAPWRVASSTVGMANNVGEGHARRGFVVEVALPLREAGLPVPNDGDQWGLQILLDQVGKNPYAAYNRYAGRDINAALGALVWGGMAERVESASISDEGRIIEISGVSASETELRILPQGRGLLVRKAGSGRWSQRFDVPGGSNYEVTVISGSLRYSFSGTAKPAVPVLAVAAPTRQAFYLAVSPAKAALKGRQSTLGLRIERDGKTLWSGSVDLSSLSKKRVIWVSYRGWPVGWYELVVSESFSDGHPEVVARIPLKVPNTPDWATFSLPSRLPAVPKPFTPVKADTKSASVFGRTYRFGNSLFLDQVKSVGENVLARPVELRGRINGKPISVAMESWKLLSQDGEKAIYAGRARAGHAVLTVRTTVEYDGAVRLDWRLAPRKNPVTVANLAFVVPVKRSMAKLYQHYVFEDFAFSKLDTWNKAGKLPESGWSGKFTPGFWLGDEQRGITWFAESRAGWTPADPNKYIEVIVGRNSTDLVLHLADRPRLIAKPIDFTFGLMASPIRPRPCSSELTGFRTYLEGDWSWFLKTNDDMRRAAVVFPCGPEEFPDTGCVEIDFRVDWDPESPDVPDVTLFKRIGRGWTPILWLRWQASSRSLDLDYYGSDRRCHTVLSAPVALAKGEWHRIALNYGRFAELFLDGRKLASAQFTGPLAAWDRLVYEQIGGSGRIALRGYRFSNAQRSVEELASTQEWLADTHTYHPEAFQHDPTVMGLTDPLVGSLSHPGYLQGNWTYDPDNHCITAGPDSSEMTRYEHMVKQVGANGAIFFFWSSRLTGHGDPAEPDKVAQIVQKAKAMGAHLLPYAPDGMADGDPAYADFKWEFSNKDPSEEPVSWWQERGEKLYSAPKLGSVRRYNLWQIDRIMRWGATGLYMDGSFYPMPASNPLLNTQKTDPITGDVVPYYPIFAMREYMKAVARLLQHYRGECTIFAHASLGYFLPTMSHVTYAVNGESLGWHKDWEQYVAPSVFAAEYHARQYGFLGGSLFYQSNPVPVELGLAIAGVHGTTSVCGSWGLYPQRAERIWALADSFDTEHAEWMPYWDAKRSPFKPRDPRVLASAFVHRGKRALLLVTNWSDTPASGEIKVDWRALRMSPDSPVRYLNWNTPLPAADGRISVPLKPRSLAYVWIGEWPPRDRQRKIPRESP